MFEDILRAAKKANGEDFDKPRNYPPAPPPQYDAPKKWYEKNWGVGLLLIICFPLGLILLWHNPRYSNTAKGGITAAILFLILYNPLAADKPVSHNTRSTYTQSSAYDDTDKSFMSYQGGSGSSGYLRQGVKWLDKKGDFRYVSETVMVEIGKQKITASDGRLTQIYFIEGSNAGEWGYVPESSISLSK